MTSKSPTTNIPAWLASTERQVRRTGGSTSARLRRRFDAPRERVWKAVTHRSQLRRWFGDVSGDLHEGATLSIDVGAECSVTARILQCKRPHQLRVTWWYEGFPPEHVDQIELRLTTDRDGTVVELEHRSADKTKWWYGPGSGWEYAIIKLSVFLQGDDPAAVSAEELDSILGPLWDSLVVAD